MLVCFCCVYVCSSVLSQEIGCEERLRNDLFYVRGRKTLTQSSAKDTLIILKTYLVLMVESSRRYCNVLLLFAVWRRKFLVVRRCRNRFVKLKVRSRKSRKIWKVNEKRAIKQTSRSATSLRFDKTVTYSMHWYCCLGNRRGIWLLEFFVNSLNLYDSHSWTLNIAIKTVVYVCICA